MDFKKCSGNVYCWPRDSSAYNTSVSQSMWRNNLLDKDLRSPRVFLAYFVFVFKKNNIEINHQISNYDS